MKYQTKFSNTAASGNYSAAEAASAAKIQNQIDSYYEAIRDENEFKMEQQIDCGYYDF